MLDTDPQCSLARWWQLRGEPDNPQIMDIDASIEALEMLIAEGWSTVVIDTPPGDIDRIEHSIFCADFVLIPCRASALDVEAVDDVVDLCKRQGKPYAFVLNSIQPGWTKLADSADEYLSVFGKVLKTRIACRKPYVSAMTLGKTGAEIDKQGARPEVDALWAEIKRLMAKQSKVR
jgi:chromosome partitioning protein